MEGKRFKRVTRSSHLTPEEAARDKEVRRKVMEELSPLEPDAPLAGGLSDSLRQAIESSPKSVYQICKEAGISQIVVSRFRSGQRDIRLATADRLARAPWRVVEFTTRKGRSACNHPPAWDNRGSS